MTTTQNTQDIRIEAWNFGRTNTLAECYSLLENADPIAARVFAALRRNEWGVEAAWKDGLKGVNIVATNPRTGNQVAFTGRRVGMTAAERAAASRRVGLR